MHSLDTEVHRDGFAYVRGRRLGHRRTGEDGGQRGDERSERDERGDRHARDGETRALHMEPPLSTRACGLVGRGQVSWLPGLPAAPSRPHGCGGQWLRALSDALRLASPITVAGPRRTLTGFP